MLQGPNSGPRTTSVLSDFAGSPHARTLVNGRFDPTSGRRLPLGVNSASATYPSLGTSGRPAILLARSTAPLPIAQCLAHRPGLTLFSLDLRAAVAPRRACGPRDVQVTRSDALATTPHGVLQAPSRQTRGAMSRLIISVPAVSDSLGSRAHIARIMPHLSPSHPLACSFCCTSYSESEAPRRLIPLSM